MPNKQYSCLHQADIRVTEATPEPLKDLSHSPVQRPTSIADIELQCTTYISDFNQMSNYKHYFLLYIARQNPEAHRTEEDSRR
jgi:hypothetical protein